MYRILRWGDAGRARRLEIEGDCREAAGRRGFQAQPSGLPRALHPLQHGGIRDGHRGVDTRADGFHDQLGGHRDRQSVGDGVVIESNVVDTDGRAASDRECCKDACRSDRLDEDATHSVAVEGLQSGGNAAGGTADTAGEIDNQRPVGADGEAS